MTTKFNKNILKVLILPLILAIGIGFYLKIRPPEKSHSDEYILANGRIEGYETNIGAKIGGRIDSITVYEGDIVKPGKLLVQMSDSDIEAQLRAKLALIKASQQDVKSAEQKLKILDSQIKETEFKVKQATLDSQGRVYQSKNLVSSAKAKLSQAKAELDQVQSQLNLAKLRKQRYDNLVAKGVVTQDESDEVSTVYETTQALYMAKQDAVRGALKDLHAAMGQEKQSKSTTYNPDIITSELAMLKEEYKQAQHDLAKAKDNVKNAIANKDEIIANIKYLKLTSPINGIVTARVVEPGAVVVPGQTVVSLINLDIVYLRAYVSDSQIGKIKVGQLADVYLDSSPNQPLKGKVIEIDPVASFTPENIYFKNDRVKEVFGIKIGFTKPSGQANPGLPADAKIYLK